MATEQSRPIVSVRGETIRRVDPEIALVSITVTGRDRDKSRATALCAARQQELAAAIAQFPDALERTETSRVSLYATYGSPRRERVEAWNASVTCEAVLRDVDAVGPFLASVGAVESATLNGPRWQVRQTSPVFRASRIAAIEDALARAADYATAVGARVEALLEIADQGMSGASPAPMMAAGGALFARSAPGAAPELDIAPAQQEIRASVEVRVAISAPTIALHSEPPAP